MCINNLELLKIIDKYKLRLFAGQIEFFDPE